MSIATEITRLQTAKADLKTAIEGKGVTVPSATKIDGYADLVDSIQTGGGGTDYLVALCNGTLTEYSSDEVTHITSSVFRGYSNLTRLWLPNCQYITGGYAASRTALRTLVLPSIVQIRNYGNFESCNSLSAVDFGKDLTTLTEGAFVNCSSLETVVLRRTASVLPLVQINVFNGTPFASGKAGGTIYVPQSLLSQYPQANNWSTLDGYGTVTWAAIEGSQYENNYVDGTPIPTT